MGRQKMDDDAVCGREQTVQSIGKNSFSLYITKEMEEQYNFDLKTPEHCGPLKCP